MKSLLRAAPLHDVGLVQFLQRETSPVKQEEGHARLRQCSGMSPELMSFCGDDGDQVAD